MLLQLPGTDDDAWSVIEEIRLTVPSLAIRLQLSRRFDLRRRSLRLRRASERHHLDETMFFSSATSTTLDSLRHGPKWAFRAKDSLRAALAA